MLLIEEESLRQMIRDAEQSFPDECCGFFFGSEVGDDRHVLKVIPVHNAKEGDKRRRFLISGKDYVAAEKFADENGLQLLGIYHSHPGHTPIPSEHDREAAQPYFSYVIISVMNGLFSSLRSWRLNESAEFEEEKCKESINQ